VTRDVEPGAFISGYRASPTSNGESAGLVRHLPELKEAHRGSSRTHRHSERSQMSAKRVVAWARRSPRAFFLGVRSHVSAQQPINHRLAGAAAPNSVARRFPAVRVGAGDRRHPLLVDTHFGGSPTSSTTSRTHRASTSTRALLGDEFRLFDPNQGNYTLEANASGTHREDRGGGDLPSRVAHLSDRPKTFAIAWNCSAPPAAPRSSSAARRSISISKAGGSSALVRDYSGSASCTRSYASRSTRTSPSSGASSAVGGRQRRSSRRSTQRGGFLEAASAEGRAGVLELFAGVERRVDADQRDRLPQQWALAGFAYSVDNRP